MPWTKKFLCILGSFFEEKNSCPQVFVCKRKLFEFRFIWGSLVKENFVQDKTEFSLNTNFRFFDCRFVSEKLFFSNEMDLLKKKVFHLFSFRCHSKKNPPSQPCSVLGKIGFFVVRDSF